jgi:type I site-specific restriction endonuclease
MGAICRRSCRKADMGFLYESTGAETFFRDTRDPDPRSRQVFAFHKPDMLAEWAHSSRARFSDME